MKIGDTYESPEGGKFVVTAFDKDLVTVEVQRLVRKNKHEPQFVEQRLRQVPTGWRFEVFARAYTILNGRKRSSSAKTGR